MPAGALISEVSDAKPLVPLSSLRSGQQGLVKAVLGDVDLSHRLREIGFCDGVCVEMIRSGRPCIVGVGGLRLGIRCDELASVLVDVP